MPHGAAFLPFEKPSHREAQLIGILGQAVNTGIWRPFLRGGQVQLNQLWMKAGELQRKASEVQAEPWSETDQKLWETTLDEVGTSLRGPFSSQQIANENGSNIWIPSRRFAIEQKQKLRPIDDFSEHSVARGSGGPAKLQFDGPERVGP